MDFSPFAVNLTVTLSKLRNLNRLKCKDTGWTLLTRTLLPHTEQTAESNRVQVLSASQTVEESTVLRIPIKTTDDMDGLLHYPLLVNFFEVSTVQKDKKKQAEDKLELIGQAAIDLMPLFDGTLEFTTTQSVYSPSYPDQKIDSQAATADESADADFVVTASCSLWSETLARQLNMITLDFIAVFNFPEILVPASPAKSNCNILIATAIPKDKEQDRYLFASARPVASSAGQPLRKRWPTHPLILPEAAVRDSYPKPETLYHLERGALCEPDDWSARYVAESSKPMVPVGTQFRCILTGDALDRLQQNLSQTKCLPVEIFELVQPEKHGGAKKKIQMDGNLSASEEMVISQHGVSFMDVRPLLYPNCTVHRVASLVETFDSQILFERANRSSLSGEIAKYMTTTSMKASSAKDGRSSVIRKGAADSAHRTTKSHSQDISMNSAAEPDQKLFETNGTYMLSEISVRRALISRCTQETAVDIVRNRLRTIIDSAKVVESNEALMKRFITSTMDQLLERTHCHVGALKVNDINAKSIELSEVNKTMELKESLKLNLTRLLRERHPELTSMKSDAAKMDSLLSDVYNELMQVASRYLTEADRRTEFPITPRPVLDSVTSLRMRALEAEIEKDALAAESCYRKRCDIDPTNMQLVRDLGHFYNRVERHNEAFQVYVKSIADDFDDFDGLVCLVNCTMQMGDLQTAREYMEAVVSLYPDSPLAWTIFGLFLRLTPSYGIGEVHAEYAFSQAKELMGLTEDRRNAHEQFLKKLGDLLAAKAAQVAVSTQAHAHGAVKHPVSARTDLDTPRAVGKQQTKRDPKGLSPGGSGNDGGQSYEASKNDPVFEHLLAPLNEKLAPSMTNRNIFWMALPELCRLGAFQMAFECMKIVGPSFVENPLLWRSAVLSCIHLNRLDQAIAWLDLVKKLDVETPDIFSLYGQVYFRTGDNAQAAESFGRALALEGELSDPFHVYFMYGLIAEKEGNYMTSAAMFLQAARIAPSCRTWLGCGKALYHLCHYEMAEKALEKANVYDNSDPIVWAYLCLAANQLGRVSVAKQCKEAAFRCGVANFSNVCSMLQER